MTTYMCAKCGREVRVQPGISADGWGIFVTRSREEHAEPWFFCAVRCLAQWAAEPPEAFR